MRGRVDPQGQMFSYFSPESRIPPDHRCAALRPGGPAWPSLDLTIVGNRPHSTRFLIDGPKLGFERLDH